MSMNPYERPTAISYEGLQQFELEGLDRNLLPRDIVVLLERVAEVERERSELSVK